VDGQNRDGNTALHFAEWNGNIRVLEVLLSHGAELDAMNSAGVTPFDIAVSEGHEEAAELLSLTGPRVSS
jgi:ankyrin repeat protein